MITNDYNEIRLVVYHFVFLFVSERITFNPRMLPLPQRVTTGTITLHFYCRESQAKPSWMPRWHPRWGRSNFNRFLGELDWTDSGVLIAIEEILGSSKA